MRVASFSNTEVDIAAPGVDVISAALGGGLVAFDGTSMATPHVAGVAALWAEKLLEQNGQVGVDALAAELLASGARGPLESNAHLEDVGAGICVSARSVERRGLSAAVTRKSCALLRCSATITRGEKLPRRRAAV